MAKDEIYFEKHQAAFFEMLKGFHLLKANHISLYYAICWQWYEYGMPDVFPVSRKKLKQASRIGSNTTYVHCLKDLQTWELIVYQKGVGGTIPAMIQVLPIQNDTDSIKNDKESVAKPSPYLVSNSPIVKLERDSLSTKNEKNERSNQSKSVQTNTPQLQEVLSYFNEAACPASEAEKFYYHYEALGWMLGTTPIYNWKSLAEKWKVNIPVFERKHAVKTKSDNKKTNTRYDTPL
jgi:hypothetical protein